MLTNIRVGLFMGACLLACWAAVAGDAKKPAKAMSQSAAKKLIAKYLKADADARGEILQALGECVIKRRNGVKRWTRIILKEIKKAGPRVKAKNRSLLEKLTGDHLRMNKSLGISSAPVAVIHTPNGDMRVVVVGKAKKPARAIIFLHGGGNTGKHKGELDNEMAWGWAVMRMKKMRSFQIQAAPRCLDDTAVNSWVLESEVRNINEVVTTLVRNFKVDPDQVFLAGQSMGGFGIWNMGDILADRFAGIAGIGGGCTIKDFTNFRNLDVGIYIGANDSAAGRLKGARKGRDGLKALQAEDTEGYPYTYKEYAGTGHNYQKTGVHQDIDAYFAKKKRRSYPRVVKWRPRVTWKHRFYNLYIANPAKGMFVKATMGKDNQVKIESKGVKALTVFLNDELANLDKEIVVAWNGKEVFRGMVLRSVRVMLRTLAERGDSGMFYTAKVELSEGGK